MDILGISKLINDFLVKSLPFSSWTSFLCFRGCCNPNLTILRDVLLTYSTFHPVVGYAQGMNDILARFLVVFDSEVCRGSLFQVNRSKQTCYFEANILLPF